MKVDILFFFLSNIYVFSLLSYIRIKKILIEAVETNAWLHVYYK